jgi:hypothetical protein
LSFERAPAAASGYEPLSLALWSELVAGAQLVVDVGAHTRVFTLVVHAANARARIIALEPYELNCARLL